MGNYSRQREEILEAIRNYNDHISAEKVYMIVKSKDPFVSKSTVYRNINYLVDINKLKRIVVDNGPDMYEEMTSVHSHAICKVCGEIFEFNYNMDVLKKEIERQTELCMIDENIYVYGVCSKCKNGRFINEKNK